MVALHLSKHLLLLLLATFVAGTGTVEIVVDETLERRRGRRIAYKGWFRDAVRSSQGVTVTTCGIRWLCLCLLVAVPWSERRWALPFCTVPVCSEKNCLKRKRAFRGAVGLTVDMVIKLRQWLGASRSIRIVGDGGFTNIDLLLHCNAQRVEQVGRLRLDAALYDEPGEQPADKRGRKAKKGSRQPSLKQRLTDPDTRWSTVDVAWYGGEHRTMQIATGTSLWHVSGNQPARLRWGLVRQTGDHGAGGAVAFFSSNVDATPERIVACYAQRWNIEVFFEEVRACLGFGNSARMVQFHYRSNHPVSVWDIQSCCRAGQAALPSGPAGSSDRVVHKRRRHVPRRLVLSQRAPLGPHHDARTSNKYTAVATKARHLPNSDRNLRFHAGNCMLRNLKMAKVQQEGKRCEYDEADKPRADEGVTDPVLSFHSLCSSHMILLQSAHLPSWRRASIIRVSQNSATGNRDAISFFTWARGGVALRPLGFPQTLQRYWNIPTRRWS